MPESGGFLRSLSMPIPLDCALQPNGEVSAGAKAQQLGRAAHIEKSPRLPHWDEWRRSFLSIEIDRNIREIRDIRG
jgi:hypothetical protein